MTILGPYLTGLAQVLLKTLLIQDVSNYDKVKVVVLDQYKITPETQRQRFRALCFKIEDRPQTLINELREYATRWLKPLSQGERELVGKVVLEQVGYAIPPAIHTWLT